MFCSVSASGKRSEPFIIRNNQPCGICEEKGSGPSVFWFSYRNEGAHKSCVKLIKKAEKPLLKRIEAVFKNQDVTSAHIQMAMAVKEACGELSIKSYLEKNGIHKLKEIFDNQGAEAVNKFAIETGVSFK